MDLPVNRFTSAVLESVNTALARPVSLDPIIWPDCVLCWRDVNSCDCDPDEASAALYQRKFGKGR